MRVELQQVWVELGGRTILRGIDLQLEPGAVTVIGGRSGAGLSTLLKTAAGLLTPQSGRVVYDGQDLAGLDARARQRLQTRTGFMFQDAALWANQTLSANLELPLRAKDPDQPAAARQRRIEAALAACGWTAALDQRPVQLSLGEQKMLAFLRAVVPGPEVLFLDEPLAALDGRWRQRLLGQLAELRTRGVTVAVVSQDPDPLSPVVDSLLDLDGGRVRAPDRERTP